MKKILIALLAVLLLAGGGAFFFLGGDSGKVETAEAEPEQIQLEKERHYLALDPITATIFRDQQPAGVFTAAVTLELVNADVRGDVVDQRRRLRDAMFRELHAMFEREEFTGRKVNVDAVKRRMLVISRRELGEDVVLDLFVNTLLRKGA